MRDRRRRACSGMPGGAGLAVCVGCSDPCGSSSPRAWSKSVPGPDTALACDAAWAAVSDGLGNGHSLSLLPLVHLAAAGMVCPKTPSFVAIITSPEATNPSRSAIGPRMQAFWRGGRGAPGHAAAARPRGTQRPRGGAGLEGRLARALQGVPRHARAHLPGPDPRAPCERRGGSVRAGLAAQHAEGAFCRPCFQTIVTTFEAAPR